MSSETAARYPDGIDERQARPVAGWRRHASPMSLAVFGLVVALALFGVLGHEREWVAQNGPARLVVDAPATIRNGEFFEMRIEVESDEPIGELVIGIDQSLWEDMTINTAIPAATDELSEDGEFRFAFGELTAGTPFLFKVDAQVNPDILGGNDGAVTLYDGDQLLTSQDVSMLVLP